jgi:hypothetical protein
MIHKKFDCLESTVDILVIPAFAAAVLMLASGLTQKPITLVAVAIPVLDPPTGLLVALTGSMTEHEDRNNNTVLAHANRNAFVGDLND